MTTASLFQRLKALEKEIQNAEVEVGVRQKQLAELKPKRQAMEAECLAEFGCPISELDTLLTQEEALLEAEVLALEASLRAAVAGEEESE